MRLVAVVLCSAFLASAFVSLLRLPQRRLLVLAGWLAFTPTVIFLVSIVNPGGLELSTALCAWTAGLVLVRSSDPPDARLCLRFGLALAVLSMTRSFGPMFVALLVVVLVLAAETGRVRELLRMPRVRWTLAAAGLATAAGIGWVVYIQTQFPVPPKPGSGLSLALDELPFWLREMVGIFGASDVQPPVGVQVAWLVPLAGLTWLTWRRTRPRHLLLAGAVAAASIVLIISGEAFSVPDIGFFWQGRYVMPLLFGAPLLLALCSRGSEPRAPSPVDQGQRRGQGDVSRWVPLLMLVAVGIHLWSFLHLMRHYTLGWNNGSRNPLTILLHPIWSPPRRGSAGPSDLTGGGIRCPYRRPRAT